MSDGTSDGARGHGWWPYLAPWGTFLLLSELGRRLPAEADPVMLIVKPGVVAALVVWFWRRGLYPELRGYRLDAGMLADVAVGVASAALWVVPFVFFASVRETMGVDPNEGFDSEQFGASLAALAIGLRLVGYALVTPFFEELFIRSFLMRVAEYYPERGDFRTLPVARYSARSFWTTVVIFTGTHLSWEWPVALAWVALTNLWFYRRGHLGSVIVVHAVANAAILAFVVAMDGRFPDGQGSPLSLWFFV